MPIACAHIPRFAVEVERKRRSDISTRSVLIGEGIRPQRLPEEIAAFGVQTVGAPRRLAALIDLATPGAPTEYRLGFNNFFVLTRYNRSSFYAAAVLELARELRRGYSKLNLP